MPQLVLHTKIGQRFVLLFVLCALIPVALFGVLADRAVSTELHTQALARVQRGGKDASQPWENPETGAINAELIYTFQSEFCRTLTDTLIRRIMVGLNRNCGRNALERAATILAEHEGWDATRKAREIEEYLIYIRRFDVPDANAALDLAHSAAE